MNELSTFIEVANTWLKSKNYKLVTHNLYTHFLENFVFPFIGNKAIGLIDQRRIKKIYTFFNTVLTNETWIGQIHLVMRMIFNYAIEQGLIQTNPMLLINDPHLKPILELSREQKNAVRTAFSKYRNDFKELIKALYKALRPEQRSSSGHGPLLKDIYEEWFQNTQDVILAQGSATISLRNMENYVIPNVGDKPIKNVTADELQAILDVYAIMGNSSIGMIKQNIRSLYSYAIQQSYVSENIALKLKGTSGKSEEKMVLSDEEIKVFFQLCDERRSVYGCILGFILCTGVRIKEALAVRYSDIHGSTLKISNQIHNGELIQATKTRRGRKIHVSRTAFHFIEKARTFTPNTSLSSTASPAATGTLATSSASTALAETTTSEVDRQDEASVEAARDEAVVDGANDFIFTNREGKTLNYFVVCRHLSAIALKMHRPDLTPHSLRHTYITVSFRHGENLNEIQNQVGHTSNVLTYFHQTKESQHTSALKRQAYLERIYSTFTRQ